MFEIFLWKIFKVLIFFESAYKLFVDLAILTVIVMTKLRYLSRRKLDLLFKLNINIEVFLFQRHVWLVQLLIISNRNLARRWVYELDASILFFLLFFIEFLDNLFQILSRYAYLEVRWLLFIWAVTFFISIQFIIHFK